MISRSMKRAHDVRDQLEGLMERVEVEITSNTDTVAIRKVRCGQPSVRYILVGNSIGCIAIL